MYTGTVQYIIHHFLCRYIHPIYISQIYFVVVLYITIFRQAFDTTLYTRPQTKIARVAPL